MENVDKNFLEYRNRLLKILQEESKLLEIVKLVGSDILPDEQKLILEVGRVIRLGFLQQAAFHEIDTYVPLKKQFLMMDVILFLYDKASGFIKTGIPISHLKEKGVFEDVVRAKYTIGNEEPEKFDELKRKLMRAFSELM
jgi:V/A-type H+-transporting ATPase subunit A